MESAIDNRAVKKETPKMKLDRNEVLKRRKDYWIFRRIEDIAFSLLGLVLLAPLFLVTAIAIVIDSPGASPIFVQDRVGRDGKIFRFYKFRSMIPGAEQQLESLMHLNEMDGPAFKIRDDPRITRVGRFIRRTCIDEFPQLLNVLKGDMSLVGPRPPLPSEVARYDEYQLQRLYVTPGLTCYWQIQPNRNNLSFDEWMNLDIQYIADSCLWKDWEIIRKTMKVVLHMQGT